MKVIRLGTVAPELVDLVVGQPPAQLRAAAVRASEWAVERTALVDPRLDSAFSALREGRVDESGARDAVKRLEGELDDRAWETQDGVAAGAAEPEEYLAAFARARAASAVWWAMDSDDLRAALEAVYEAQAATGEIGAVRGEVEGLLQAKPSARLGPTEPGLRGEDRVCGAHHTHAATLNGSITGEVTNPHRSELEELRWMVESLDGQKRYSWLLWRLPPGVPVDRVDARAYPTAFLRCAGTRDRMVIEVRYDGSAGRPAGHYVVGRPVDDEGDKEVRWDRHSTVVRSSEVFDAEQALAVLVAYYETDDVPPGHSLRPLDPDATT